MCVCACANCTAYCIYIDGWRLHAASRARRGLRGDGDGGGGGLSCLCHRVNRFCILFPSAGAHIILYAYLYTYIYIYTILKPYLLRSPPQYSHRLLAAAAPNTAAAQHPSCIASAAIFSTSLCPTRTQARARALHAHYF